MGKIQQGILGAFSGKVGNVVGATWRGIPYMRIMPASVANPRTPGQVNQRSKFSSVGIFLSDLLPVINVGYRFHAIKRSPSNAAMAHLLETAITGTAPDFTVDYPNALISRGKLLAPESAAVAIAPGTATLSWTDNSGQGTAHTSDVALIVAYSPARHDSVMIMEGFTRGDASAGISIPAYFSGDTLEFYLSFKSADGKTVSNSVHAGSEIAA